MSREIVLINLLLNNFVCFDEFCKNEVLTADSISCI